jgi:integrase
MEDMTMAKNKDHNLVQRGDTWYLQKVVNGRRLKRALSKSVTEARRLRDQFLQEIAQHGRIVDKADTAPQQVLFGEVAQSWAKVTPKRLKSSTFRDYRSAMNYYILDRFGNLPISGISFLDIEEFLAELECSNKRKNNVLVPMRGVFKLAMRAGYIEKDPMELVRNLKTQKPDIAPLSMDEVRKFLDIVSPRYRDFFSVAIFSGMRFGEMSALKWKNVDFKLGVIRVRETRVDGEEGCPKTPGSVRDVKILPPVAEALRSQRRATMGKSPYVFLNFYGRPLFHHSVNIHMWKPALKKVGLSPRPLIQTRHTFATLMLDAGEQPGWVARMMGHVSLKMIHERYYSYIKNYQRDDGAAFMNNVYGPNTAPDDEAGDNEAGRGGELGTA